jgi:hypothetical protein
MTNGVSCHEHSVAESELLFLTNRHKVHHVGNRSHGAKVLNITALLKDRLKVG